MIPAFPESSDTSLLPELTRSRATGFYQVNFNSWTKVATENADSPSGGVAKP